MIFFGWNGPVGFVATAGVMLHHDPKMMGGKTSPDRGGGGRSSSD